MLTNLFQEKEVQMRQRLGSLKATASKQLHRSQDSIRGFMGLFGRDGRIVSNTHTHTHTHTHTESSHTHTTDTDRHTYTHIQTYAESHTHSYTHAITYVSSS